MSRLIVVSELFYPEQTSTGYFLTEIAKSMAPYLDVTVLCGQPSYSERGVRAPRRESWHGLNIVRIRSTHFNKDRLLLRAVNVLTFTLSCLFNLMFRLRTGDQLLLVTNPPSLVPLAGPIARMKGARAILLVHDVYPEILAATGIIRSGSAAFRILAWVMCHTLHHYSRIVVLGRDMQLLMQHKSGKPLSEIPIIRNWADHDEIIPLERLQNPFAQAHAIEDKVVIQFSGNIGRTHDIGSILNTAKALQGEPDLEFIFVGYGGKANDLADHLEREEIANVRFLPRQPREWLGAMLASATATVIPLEQGMTGLSVPSRLYNIFAAGVPIIAMADENSELAMTVAETGAGWVLPQGDSAALSDLCRHLTTPLGREEAATKGQAARDAAVKYYGFDAVVKQYRSLLSAS